MALAGPAAPARKIDVCTSGARRRPATGMRIGRRRATAVRRGAVLAAAALTVAVLAAGERAAAQSPGTDAAASAPAGAPAAEIAPETKEAKDALLPLPDWSDPQLHEVRPAAEGRERWWQALRREIPACATYTDGCHICRIDDGGAACSNTPVACQPTPWRCGAQP
ncbi:MAG: hypothetical protein M5U33_01400 [Pseudorhodoplanes sp.]|nr:hypothetical protein [Pseudorhodoplanes sp.]